jgi:anti-sigma factor RsiW
VNADPHERARLMIAWWGPEGLSHAGLSHAGLSQAGLSQAEQSWLAVHLESCPACREFAENSRETIRSLRGIPITAGASLVSTTRTRVRQRAQELQRRQERMRVIWVCSAAVTLCTAFNTAVLWRGVGWLSQWLSQQWGQQWIGQQAGLSAPLFELGFVALCSMPAIVAGIILLARGTYMADHNGSFQG